MKKAIGILLAPFTLSLLVAHTLYAAQPDKQLRRPLRVKQTAFEQSDFVLAGSRVRVIDVGEGQPLLLIHGHQSRLEEFETIVPALSKHFRVIAFDLPGSGYSDKPDLDYSLELYRDYTGTFIEQYIGEPVIIAGGSMGGNISLLVARRYPHLVKKVVAWSPAGAWEKHEAMSVLADTFMNTFLYRLVLNAQSQFWHADSFEGKEEAIRDTFSYIDEVDCQSFRNMAARLAADQLNNSHLGQGHLNKQPTLIMVGEKDEGLGLAEHAIRFSKELPDGELVVFVNTGHSITAARPDELVHHIIRFAK